jgi:DNA polymerase III sliding clamp (beta) subunit (PCNA family)
MAVQVSRNKASALLQNATPQPKGKQKVTKELKVVAEKLAKEVSWLNKMPTVEPVSAIVQITAVIGAVIVRRVSDDQYRESIVAAGGGDQVSITVAASKLLDALKSLEGPLTITINDEDLTLESSERKVTIRSASSAVNFPEWPQFTGQGFGVLMPDNLTQVLTSVGNDDNLPALKTVAFDNGTMVSTDRHRLTRVTYGQSGFTGQVESASLRAFAKTNTAVFVEAGTVNDRPWVQLRSTGRSCTSPMADVSFPNWRKLIPEDQPLKVVFDREQMLKAITGTETSLTIDSNSIIVVGENGDSDIRTEQKVDLYQTVQNEFIEPVSVSISSKLLADSLRGLGSKLAVLGITDPTSPVVISDLTDALHLVMPIKKAS